jgi:hypothetical protein
MTSGGHSVGIVRLQTEATDFFSQLHHGLGVYSVSNSKGLSGGKARPAHMADNLTTIFGPTV